MTTIRTSNATLVVVDADEHRPLVRVFIRRAATEQAACQAVLSIDQASELAATLANLVDAAKRGQ